MWKYVRSTEPGISTSLVEPVSPTRVFATMYWRWTVTTDLSTSTQVPGLTKPGGLKYRAMSETRLMARNIFISYIQVVICDLGNRSSAISNCRTVPNSFNFQREILTPSSITTFPKEPRSAVQKRSLSPTPPPSPSTWVGMRWCYCEGLTWTSTV